MISKTTFTAIVFYFVYSGICEAEGGVSIYGELVNYNDTTIINITCTSDFASSTAEFIINEISEDQVRFHDGRCYHRNNECKPTTCSCYPNHFTLLHRVAAVKSDLEAACKMRFINQDESKELKTTATLLFNGIEFFNVENPPEVLSNNEPSTKDGNEARRTSVAVEVSVLICVGIVILLSSICFIYRCLKKLKWIPFLGEHGKGQYAEKELHSLCAQSPVFGKLKDTTDEDMVGTCNTCKLASVCAICSDCQKLLCDICCITHARSKPNHRVYQIDHGVTSNLDVKCKSCQEKVAENVCMTCIRELCFACSKHHIVFQRNHVIKHLVLTKRRDGERKRKESEHLPYIKYKYTITTYFQQPRICGVCFITDGRIAITEYKYKQLQIYSEDSLLITHDLGQEPKGITSIGNNRVAITYPYERQIKLYKIFDSSVNNLTTFLLTDKPFSIAYNYPNFAVEMGEGDDGVIAILNETGDIIYEISNATSFAHFTSNTIRLALDSENRKVFVASFSKKSVSCIDYAGNIIWRKPVSSPRGLVFVGNITSERNMIIAIKRWNLIFNMNSVNGQNDIIMSCGRVESPRYIDYNLDKNLLCIQVDNGKVLVYEYDITDAVYLRSDSNP